MARVQMTLCHDSAVHLPSSQNRSHHTSPNAVRSLKFVFISFQIDHFAFVNQGTFKQRILINDSYWDAGKQGPIFFYTGNEGDIEAFAQNSVSSSSFQIQ